MVHRFYASPCSHRRLGNGAPSAIFLFSVVVCSACADADQASSSQTVVTLHPESSPIQKVLARQTLVELRFVTPTCHEGC